MAGRVQWVGWSEAKPQPFRWVSGLTLHWMPAAWPPGSYHDRTSTGEQTMAFQDTPRFVSPFLDCKGSVFFTLQLRKHALLYQAGLEVGLFQLQDHNGFAC